jgi:hypothetical protein
MLMGPSTPVGRMPVASDAQDCRIASVRSAPWLGDHTLHSFRGPIGTRGMEEKTSEPTNKGIAGTPHATRFLEYSRHIQLLRSRAL